MTELEQGFFGASSPTGRSATHTTQKRKFTLPVIWNYAHLHLQIETGHLKTIWYIRSKLAKERRTMLSKSRQRFTYPNLPAWRWVVVCCKGYGKQDGACLSTQTSIFKKKIELAPFTWTLTSSSLCIQLLLNPWMCAPHTPLSQETHERGDVNFSQKKKNKKNVKKGKEHRKKREE